MYKHVYIHVCMHIHIYIHVCIYTYMLVTYVHTHMRVDVAGNLCTHTRVTESYTCMSVTRGLYLTPVCGAPVHTHHAYHVSLCLYT